MKIFLSGQKSFGLATLQLLRRLKHQVVGIAAPPRNGRGLLDPLFGYANAWEMPVIASDNLRSENLPDDTDLIVAAHSHAYIGRKTRHKAKHGAIGYHPSLLPRHRGRDAVKWTIKMRDPIGGGSVFWLNDNVDGGEIAAQEWCFVAPDDNASTLWKEKLFPMGIALLAEVLNDIQAGKLVKIPQDERCATWEPALNQPPIFRPELPQLSTGVSTSDKQIKFQVESDFKKTMDFYAIP